MSFKTRAIADAKTTFLNLNEVAEVITYTPIATGVAKSIKAIVEDNPEMSGLWDDGTGSKATLNIHITNDATFGVASPVRRDSILRAGTTYFVNSITGPEVDGMIVLGVIEVNVDEKGGVRRVDR